MTTEYIFQAKDLDPESRYGVRANTLLHKQPKHYLDPQYGYLPLNYVRKKHDQRFYAVLQFDKSTGIRSGYLYWWRDVATGRTYPMGHKGLLKLLKTGEFVGVGLVDGLWEIRKHGAHVTIVPITADERDDEE